MATAKSAALSDLDLAINSGNERALIFAINEAAPFISEEARLLAYKRWRDLVQDVEVDEHFGEMELIQPLLGLRDEMRRGCHIAYKSCNAQSRSGSG